MLVLVCLKSNIEHYLQIIWTRLFFKGCLNGEETLFELLNLIKNNIFFSVCNEKLENGFLAHIRVNSRVL